MDVWVRPDGLRDREFRPYVNGEELANSVYLYSPNGPGFHYGLYDQSVPNCGYWEDIYQQFPSKVPAAVVDSTGRMHLVRPNWYRHGYKYDGGEKFEPLLRHTRPTGQSQRR